MIPANPKPGRIPMGHRVIQKATDKGTFVWFLKNNKGHFTAFLDLSIGRDFFEEAK